MSFTNMFRTISNAIILILLMSHVVVAEPGWVKEAVRCAEEITPHEDAPAIALLRHAATDVSSAGKVKSKVRLVTRILSAEGASYAVIQEWESSIRDVRGLKGWLVRANGEKQTLDKENIVRVGADERMGYYHDAFRLMAHFPDATSGDVVAYEYNVVEKGYFDCLCQNFEFQRSIPVVSARYDVTVPDEWKLRLSERNLGPVEDSAGVGRFVWKCGFLPYQPEEPHMPPWDEVARSVEFCCYDPFDEDVPTLKDWGEVSEWARTIHDPAAEPDDAIRSRVDLLCQGLTTDEEKLTAIANFVRDEIRYVAVEIGIGRFQPRPAGNTLLNRYGDCKDKATLMRALLAEAGIPSVPVLACAGGDIDPDFPSAFQFNHVILAVPLDSVPGLQPMPRASADGWLFFDPTHTALPLGRLPSQLHKSLVMPFSADDSVLCELPQLAPEDRYRRYRASARLKRDLTFEANITITDYGNWAAETREYHATSAVKDRQELIVQRFARTVQDVTLEDYRTGSDADSAWTEVLLRGKPTITQAGEMYLLKADFFHGDSPGDLVEKERVHPIWFGQPALTETSIDWTLPEGLSFETCHEVIADSCAVACLRCDVSADGRNLALNMAASHFGGKLQAEAYDQAQDLERKTGTAVKYRAIITQNQDGTNGTQDSL